MPVFGFGPMPPFIHLVANNMTQQVDAGGTAVYYVRVTPGWPAGWLNVTVGSKYIVPSGGLGVGELPQVEPLPLGVEANYSKRIFVNASDTYILPVSVKVAPSMGQSTINLTVLVAGTYRTEFNYNDTYFRPIDLRLYVEPKTNIPTATTITTSTFSTTLTSTSTTTLSTTLTSTTTAISTERVADLSTYVWAVIATVADVVLAALLLLRRRDR